MRIAAIIVSTMSKLIIIRGNSGSGKTTVATRVRKAMVRTILIQQDVVRIGILNVDNKKNNPAINLIYEMATYGKKIDYDVILEGILANNKYAEMLSKLIADFRGEVYAYYLDVSFEETLRRHSLKPNAHEYGEDEMRLWWKEKDYLGIEEESILGAELSEDQVVDTILSDIARGEALREQVPSNR